MDKYQLLNLASGIMFYFMLFIEYKKKSKVERKLGRKSAIFTVLSIIIIICSIAYYLIKIKDQIGLYTEFVKYLQILAFLLLLGYFLKLGWRKLIPSST